MKNMLCLVFSLYQTSVIEMLKIVGIGEGHTCKVGPVRSHVFVIPLFSERFA